MKQLYIIIVILMLTFLGRAQIQKAKTFILDVPMTWQANYEAKESIVLRSGFSYNAINGSGFSAKINSSITSTENLGNGDISQGITTGYIGTGQVGDAPPGALPLEVDVNASGASAANMMFSFPNGFGGIGPQVGMSYSSQSNDGAFGKNWNLTGLSAISRTPQSYYYDGNSQELKFDNTDRLILDGNRMFLKTGTNLNAGSTYYLESERFVQNITSSNETYLNAPAFFTIVEKNGTIITYGGSGLDSKIIVNQTINGVTSKKVAGWLISKITDLKGNYLRYNYSNIDDGQIKLTSIEYTGNNVIGLTPKYKIEFTYDTFSKTESKYNGGAMFNYNLYIKSIKLKDNISQTELSRYDFTYNNKKLIEISLYTKGNLVCKPTRINWNTTIEKETLLQYSEWDNSLEDFNDAFEYRSYDGDFTGGGKREILKINGDYEKYDWKILSNSNGILTDIHSGVMPILNKYEVTRTLIVDYEIYFDWWDFRYDIKYFSAPRTLNAGKLPYTVFDIDRDGLNELCVIEANKSLDPDNCHFKVYDFVGNNIIENESYRKLNVGMFSIGDQLLVGDFNGTGNYDIFKIKMGRTNMSEIVTSLTSSNQFNLSSIPLEKTFSLFNFNGNGKTDIMTVTETKVAIFEVTNINNVCVFNEITSILNVNPKQVLEGDYNSDGLQDLLIFNGITNKWQLYCSNGIDKFILKESSFTSLLNINNGGPSGEQNYSIDPEAKYFTDGNDYLGYYINGANLDPEQLNHMYKTAYCNKYISTDLNVDGKTDVIRINRYAWPEGATSNPVNFNFFCTQYDLTIFLANETGFDIVKYNGATFKYERGNTSSPLCYPNSNNKIGLIEYQFSREQAFNNLLVSDYNTDGFPELIYHTDQYIYINGESNGKVSCGASLQFFGGEDEGFISSITNGMNVKTSINYGNLKFGDNYAQTPTVGLSPDVHEYFVPIKVVTSKIVSVNSNETSHTNFSYINLRFHNQKGFLGVKSFTADDIISGIKTIAEYSLDNTYIIPYVSIEKQYINGNLVSLSNYDYLSVSKGGKKYFQYLNSTSTTNSLTGHKVTTAYSINTSNGNVNSETKTYGTDGSVVINYIGYNIAGQPSKISTTRNQNGSFTSSTDYTYDNFGNVKSITNNDNITTVYTYCADNTNVDFITENAYNTITRFTYDASKLLITKKELEYSNGVKHIQTFSYDNDGRLIRSVDENGLTSYFQYDIFGNLSVKLMPNGGRIASCYGWSSGTNNIAWFKKVTDDSGNISYVYFDLLGRQIRQESTPSGGNMNSLEAYFNTDGTINREVSNVNGTTSYAYKNDGRLSSVTSMGKTLTYSYSLGKTTTTLNGVSSSQILNAFGQVVKVNDTGGDINYTYHASGNVESTTTNGHTITMAYNVKGRQISLNDPDAGLITYDYDPLGRPYSMSDIKGNKTVNTYDAVFGRLETQTTTPGIGVDGAVRVLTYQYDPDNQHYGFIKQINNSESGITTVYGYDRLGRTTSISENILGVTYCFKYEYDNDGKVTRIIYPDGFSLTNGYSGNYLSKIIDDKTGIELFKNYIYNLRGQVESYTQGNNNKVNNSFDSYGNIDVNEFGPTSNRVKYDYSFDINTGLISGRSKIKGGITQSEIFSYDNLYRLTNWNITQSGTTKPYTINYSSNGNIVQKSDIGYYAYDATKTHAVTSVSQLSGSAFSTSQNNISYNAFNKITTANLVNGSNIYDTYSITYGPDNQRRIANKNGDLTIYFGLYEVRSNGDKLHYIQTPDGLCGLIVINGNTQTNYYLHNDHLGSLIAAEASNGNLTEFSYDPWGRRRNPLDWNDYSVPFNMLFTRGFTGHEHIDDYGLINMNGRIYDARLGRFLSPDPYIQNPGFTQNYNRYSYCLNNPLNLTDPSGYRYTDRKGVQYRSWFDKWGPVMTIGTVAAVATWGTAGLMAPLTTGLVAAELASMTAAITVVSGMVGGAVAGMANTWAHGGTLGESLAGAFMGGVMGGLMAAIIPGIVNGIGNRIGQLPAGDYMTTIRNGGGRVKNPTVALRVEEFVLRAKLAGYSSLFEGVANASIPSTAASCVASNVVAQSGGGYLYYLAEEGITGHAMVWNPYSNKIYEIHIPGYGQDGNSAFVDIGLWASGRGDEKSIRYVYNMKRDIDLFKTTSNRDRNDDGVMDISYAKVWVPDINASINFFESNPGGAWDYALPYSNCKHYAIQGLEAGGANIKWSGPVPVNWQSPLTPFDPAWFNQ